MYSEIQALKGKGFKKSQVASKLKINFRTVDKHWDMTPKEFDAVRAKASTRTKQPDFYRDDILEWLKKYPDMSSAQIYDWLLEKFGVDVGFAERTARRYIRQLRIEEDIPKVKEARQYEAVEDPPMGYQSQVDMGEIWLVDGNDKRCKLYCFAMVMSNSRHKYVLWQQRPFTTATFIEAHEKAFSFFGGRPKEIVYDQDKVLTVSENNGDIIHTEAFQTYLSMVKFKVYLCRGNDPETKGRVEAVIKYVKNNFAKNRVFSDVDSLNNDCLKWLERRGNGKRHGITQKIPAEVFALEKDYLTPVSPYEASASGNGVTYQVRKDNTVIYRTNRYGVPKGTYRPGLKVRLKISGSSMIIMDSETEIIYARHMLSLGKGELVPVKRKRRELNKLLTELLIMVKDHFHNTDEINHYIERIREDKPRYIRDQLCVMRFVCEHPSLNPHIHEALDYCIKNNIYSGSDFRAATEYFYEINKVPVRASPKPNLSKSYPVPNPKIRNVNEYKKAMEGH